MICKEGIAGERPASKTEGSSAAEGMAGIVLFVVMAVDMVMMMTEKSGNFDSEEGQADVTDLLQKMTRNSSTQQTIVQCNAVALDYGTLAENERRHNGGCKG